MFHPNIIHENENDFEIINQAKMFIKKKWNMSNFLENMNFSAL